MTLLPGDLLLWRVDKGASWIDRLVGWGEHKLRQVGPKGYQYYHVATVSADVTKMYSSQPPKIDLYPVPNPLPSNVEVYRINQALEPKALASVFAYAESKRGKLYPILDVLTFGWIKVGGLEFCSQYTEDQWLSYPLVLCPSAPQFTTPDDIAASQLLIRAPA